VLSALIDQLRSGQSLDRAQVSQAVRDLIDEHVAVEAKAELLIALAQKGETAEEITAFALELRQLSIAAPLDAALRDREILDVWGTGGARLNTFNISTTVALIAAAAGITVAKHGNRAITSQAGSADVLEALGIRIDLPPAEAARMLAEHQFAFFFAPRYHPVFQQINPARRLCAERGQRTLFNFLGPLLNPARPSAQLIGVPNPQLCEPIGRVLQSLGVRRGMILSGRVDGHGKEASAGSSPAYLDELSTLGENTIAEFYQDRGFAVSTLSHEHFPLRPAVLADLAGGDRTANAAIVRNLLSGEDQGPKRDAVLLNAAAALFVGGRTRSLSEGWATAAEMIDSGRASAKLDRLRLWT
jgi:anthranilate phosphoribosyltransferase